MDDSTVDFEPFYITHARGDNSGRSYEFVLGDLDDYIRLDNYDSVLAFIRNMTQAERNYFNAGYKLERAL